MIVRHNLAAALVVGFAFAPISALAAPPADSMPVSKIVQGIEQRSDFRYIKEVDWDDDGHYEIEYVTTDGARVEIKVNPRTGEPIPRR